ncbi:MAG: AMP-binding protein [Acidimicrobiales bacterium]
MTRDGHHTSEQDHRSAGTVGDLLAEQAEANPDGAAIVVDGGAILTFGDWDRRSNALARGLVARGLHHGDRIAVVFDLARADDAAVATIAVHKLGAVAVPLAPRFPELDLVRILRHVRAAAVICPTGQTPAGAARTVDDPAGLEADQSAAPLPSPVVEANRPAEVLYSLPGAMRPAQAITITHGRLLSSPLNGLFGPGGVVVNSLPLGTAAGQEALRLTLRQGRTVVTLTPFDPERLCRLVHHHSATSLALRSWMVQSLLDSGTTDDFDVSSVGRVLVEGGALPPSTAARLAAAFPHASVVPVPDPEAEPQTAPPAPLAPSQEGMVWHEQLAPGSFNLAPLVRRLRGPLDVVALGGALNEIVRRHAPLRTTFTIAGGEGAQVVAPHRRVQVPLVDLGHLSAASRQAELSRLLAGARARPFDLVAGPLFRPSLVRLGADDHVLVVRAHHSVFDDWSVAVFRRELSLLYQAMRVGEPAALPQPTVPFAELARRQRRRQLDGEVWAAERSYWANELTGAPLSVQLPIDDPARPVASALPAAEPLALELPLQLARSLRAVARQERTTLFSVMLAGFSLLVQRYTGGDDVVLSTLVANRDRTEVQGLIGCFSKKVPLRVRLDGDPTFAEVLRRARTILMGALAHQDMAYEAIIDEALGGRAAAHGLSPQVTIKLQAEVRAGPPLQLTDVRAEPLPLAPRGAPGHFLATDVDVSSPPAPWGSGLYLGTFLGLSLADDGETLTLAAEGVFHRPAVARLLGHFTTLLTSAAANLHGPVSELSLFDADGRAELARAARGDEAPVPDPLHHAVAAQARATPERAAVTTGPDTLTYAELDAGADDLASRLRTAGVDRGSIVGLCLEPGAGVVVAALAVWRAGGAWAGLDPSDGVERFAWVVADAGIKVVVAAGAGAALAVGHGGLTIVDPAAPPTDDVGHPPGPSPTSEPTGLATVFYGSGEAAPDHGVALEHRSLANLWASLGPGLDGGERRVCRVGFHGATGEERFIRELVALAGGHTLRLLPPDEGAPPLIADLAAGRVDVLECGQAELQSLIDAGLDGELAAAPIAAAPPLLMLVATGPVELALWQSWQRLAGVRRRFFYGPPECGFAAVGNATDDVGERPATGGALANCRAWVLDARGTPVPAGATGELHVGGANLAAGYWNHDSLTATRFVPDPELADERLWRSGQLARSLPGGAVELLGAICDHVDVGGFAVRPRSIEAVLSRCPGVRRACVVVDETRLPEPCLVAYVVPDGDSSPCLAELRRFLWRQLPGYAWPAVMVVVEDLPEADQDRVETTAAHGDVPPPLSGRAAPAGADSNGSDPAAAVARQRSLLAAAWAASGVERSRAGGSYWHTFSFLDALAEMRRAGHVVDTRTVAKNRTVETLATALAAQEGFDATPSPGPAAFPSTTPARAATAKGAVASEDGRQEAIRARGLTKTYPAPPGTAEALTAVDGLDLTVHTGEIFGLLGPNGAGKTTTVGMLTTRVVPTSGQVVVNGVDVVADPARAKRSIGVVPQLNTLDRSLTVRENLWFHGRYFGMSAAAAGAAADELLERFKLAARAGAEVHTLSGGMAQRLMVARAILHRPVVLFLDEPTAGLDPQSRLALWEIVAALHDEGQTILLTTHYMEEADHFCDRVAIMDHGRVLALDTPAALTGTASGDGSVAGGDAGRSAVAVGGRPGDRVTLETVFINLTGRDLRE